MKVYNKRNLAVLNAVSKDSIKPILNAVKFTQDGRVVGADGLILMETTISDRLDSEQAVQGSQERPEPQEDIHVNANDVKALKLTKFKGVPVNNDTFVIGAVDMKKQPKRVELKTFMDDDGGVNKREANLVEGVYPKYEQLFDIKRGEVRAKIRISPNLLMKMARALKQFQGSDNKGVYVSVRGDREAVLFEAENDMGQEFRGLIMPMVMDKEHEDEA